MEMTIVVLKNSMTEMDFFGVDLKATVGRGRKSGTEGTKCVVTRPRGAKVGLKRGKTDYRFIL